VSEIDTSIKGILEEAEAEVLAVLNDAFKELGMPPIPQEKLRAAFGEALQTPEGVAAFQRQHGNDEFSRQMMLALKRAEVNSE
jgi:hypothetical protein